MKRGKQGITTPRDERKQRNRAAMPKSQPKTETIFDRPIWTPTRDKAYTEMLKRIDAEKQYIK